MPRKRRSTKSRIVKAAWNLFYKNGYEQTTVEDIINASKTSKGTFYHYFKGKEALLNSLSYLFDQKYEDLAAVIDPNLSCYDKLLFLNHELFYIIETNYPAFTVPRGFKCRNNREINDTHTNLTTSIYCSKPSSITSPVESKRTELRALR